MHEKTKKGLESPSVHEVEADGYASVLAAIVIKIRATQARAVRSVFGLKLISILSKSPITAILRAHSEVVGVLIRKFNNNWETAPRGAAAAFGLQLIFYTSECGRPSHRVISDFIGVSERDFYATACVQELTSFASVLRVGFLDLRE